MKICSKCGRELPLENFVKDRWSKDGFKSICKECRREKMKEARVEREGKDPYAELKKQGIFTKTCSVCGLEKPVDEFQKNINSLDGLLSQCKSCASEKRKPLREQKRKHMVEIYYPAHKEERRAYNKKYHLENADAIKA